MAVRVTQNQYGRIIGGKKLRLVSGDVPEGQKCYTCRCQSARCFSGIVYYANKIGDYLFSSSSLYVIACQQTRPSSESFAKALSLSRARRQAPNVSWQVLGAARLHRSQ